MRRCVSHPVGTVFQARLLDNRVPIPNDTRNLGGKFSSRYYLMPTPTFFWAPLQALVCTYSNCRETERGRSAQEGVMVWWYVCTYVSDGCVCTLVWLLYEQWCVTRDKTCTRGGTLYVRCIVYTIHVYGRTCCRAYSTMNTWLPGVW